MNNKKRLMVVDGNNQYLRAYIVNPSLSPNGQPIGGVTGTLKILQKLCKEINPDHIIKIKGRGFEILKMTDVITAAPTKKAIVGNTLYADKLLTFSVTGFTTVITGLSVDFVAEYQGGDSPYTFGWDFGDNSGTASTETPTYVYGIAGTYTVKLTVTDANNVAYTTEESVVVA